ncbi:reverse transcriptase [Stemphylium lycopersici]|uniref:Reverse transcriptase n=1 Tax=Stemphylium lycopersici TaxID=183478 RepID=A0A364MR89_STELY|nr:reverse transcriptase [Stemphylium lycopersici]
MIAIAGNDQEQESNEWKEVYISDQQEQKEIEGLSGKEIIQKIGIQGIIGARKEKGGVLKLFTAQEQDRKRLETQKEWTVKLGKTAKVSHQQNMVIAHGMTTKFDIEGDLKRLQDQNQAYNVNKSQHKVQRSFLQALDPKKHLVIAVQEPWINSKSNRPSTANDPRYHTLLAKQGTPRTCMYISKEMATDSWEQIQQEGGDITSVRLNTNQGSIHIHSVYNPPPSSRSSTQLGTLQQLPDILQSDSQHIRASSSTIDLCFASHDLQQKVTRCWVNQDLESSSDHLPIQVEFETQTQQEGDLEPQLAWKAANWEQIRQDLEQKLAGLETRRLETALDIDQAVAELVRTMQETAAAHTREKKQSLYQKPFWTKECSEKVKAARQARRALTQSHSQEAWDRYNQATRDKKAQIKRDKMLEWRSTVGSITQNPEKMWKLAKWARQPTQDRNMLPQFPNIEDQEGVIQHTLPGKAQALGKHFFGTQVEADLQDLEGSVYPTPLEQSCTVGEGEIKSIIKRLSGNKAPGPDGIPNLFIKTCKDQISPALSNIFSQCMAQGHCPKHFKESLTVVLRKPQKEDYTKLKAYRPIALLNTLGKLLEKIIAERLTNLAEEHGILPEEQMGGRKQRSTLTAVELITEQIKTLWHFGNNKAATLLSLDISGAFDNVSHQRLIHILKQKAIPNWTVQFIQSFLRGRTTRLRLGRYKSDSMPTETGIPQGSTMSPILFLLFMADLPAKLNSRNTSASGFVDDTNILAWSDSTEENCRILQKKHKECEEWARKHGARFAPEKYQLIHFSRARNRHNMQAPITIQGHTTEPSSELRVLGIWMDPKLSWGPQIWSAQDKIPKRIADPISRAQASCLKKVLGAYKSTPTRVVEMESGSPPAKLYLQGLRYQYAGKTSAYPAQLVIQKAVNKIRSQCTRRHRQARPNPAPQKQQDLQKFKELTEQLHLAQQEQDRRAQGRGSAASQGKKQQSLAERMAGLLWKTEWTRTPQRPGTPKALQQFGSHNYLLYSDLTRSEASIAIQIRSEHIGVRAYLHQRKVPGIEDKSCPCGYLSQNVEHRLLVCKEWSTGRGEWRARARNRNFQAMISNKGDLQRITRWIIHQGFLEQFSLTRETERWIEERKKEEESRKRGTTLGLQTR